MQDTLEAIIFGFKEILNYRIMKLALFIGVLVTLFWSLFAYLTWSSLVMFSSYFIDLVPFSMLRSNGAWIFSSFIWFSLILVTFALIMLFFGNMILEKISREKYSSFSLLIVFVSTIFWSIIWFYNGDVIHNAFTKLLNWLPFETVQASLAYFMSLYFVYSAIVATMLIVTSFYSETLLSHISSKEYPYDELLEENELQVGAHRARDIGIYLLVSVLAFPLLFIPILNFIVQLGLWIWLIKDTFVSDSVALLIKENEQELLEEHKVNFFILSSFTALFNFLPLFNILGPFFGEIAVFYYIKEIKKRK